MNYADTPNQDNTSVNIFSITVGTSVVNAIPSNDRRIALIISGDATNRITLNTLGLFVDQQGIVIPSASSALHLDFLRHGNLVRRPLQAIASGSSSNLTIVEVSRSS